MAVWAATLRLLRWLDACVVLPLGVDDLCLRLVHRYVPPGVVCVCVLRTAAS